MDEDLNVRPKKQMPGREQDKRFVTLVLAMTGNENKSGQMN
jgi:hypothetical protein